MGSLPSRVSRSLTVSSISRNDMSGLTPGTSYVSNFPAASGPAWRQAVSVMRIVLSVTTWPSFVGTGRGMDIFEFERLLVQLGNGSDARELPGRDVAEVLVVAQCFAVFGLVF